MNKWPTKCGHKEQASAREKKGDPLAVLKPWFESPWKLPFLEIFKILKLTYIQKERKYKVWGMDSDPCIRKTTYTKFCKQSSTKERDESNVLPLTLTSGGALIVRIGNHTRAWPKN